jgi:hypothetical protein
VTPRCLPCGVLLRGQAAVQVREEGIKSVHTELPASCSARERRPHVRLGEQVKPQRVCNEPVSEPSPTDGPSCASRTFSRRPERVLGTLARQPKECHRGWCAARDKRLAATNGPTLNNPKLCTVAMASAEAIVRRLRPVLATAGGVIPGFVEDSAVLLRDGPRGAYTTARTHRECTTVFDLTGHINRLAESSRLIQTAQGIAEDDPRRVACHVEWVRSQLLENLRAAIDEWLSRGEPTSEAKVTVLVTWDHGEHRFSELLRAEDPASMLVHLQLLKPPHVPPIRVRLHLGPRKNAAAKDSAWVSERSSLERFLASGYEEVVLCDHHHHGDGEGRVLVMEGTQTNFAVASAGTVLTASEGILRGTVRNAMLHRAKAVSIPTVEEAPSLADLARWDSAAVLSTSRLVMQLDEVHVPAALFLLARGAPPDAAASEEAVKSTVAAAVAETGVDSVLPGGGRLSLESVEGEPVVVRTFDTSLDTALRRLREEVLAEFEERCERIP